MAESSTRMRPKHGYRSSKPLVDSTVVTITVGKDFGEEQGFVLLREYLTTVSEFFENSFRGSFREANKNSLTLDDVEVGTFKIFVEWLHGCKLLNSDGEEYDGKQDGEKELKDDNTGPSRSRMPELLSTYILADQLDIPQLRKDALEVYIKYQGAFPYMCASGVVENAYKRLPLSSPFLCFLVDVYVHTWTPTFREKGFPNEFLYDVAVKLRTEIAQCRGDCGRKSPYQNPAKYYESHGEEEAET